MGASATFGAELDALGVWRPHGNGDALREVACTWTQTADLIEEVTSVLQAVVSSVAHRYHGEAATKFAEMWKLWGGDAGYLPTTVADCRRLAAASGDFGTDVDVADRALASLVEQALAEAATAPTPTALLVLLDWLLESAGILCSILDTQATQHVDDLGAVQAIDPNAPDLVTAFASDPTLVSWRDPGQPVSLGNLGTAPVDFGAGPGVPTAGRPPTVDGSLPPSNVPSILPPIVTPLPPAMPLQPSATLPTSATIPSTPAILSPLGQPTTSTNTITINGNGNTVTIGSGGLSSIPNFSPSPSSKVDPLPTFTPPKVDAIPLAAPKPLPAFVGGTGSGSSHPLFTPPTIELAPLAKTTLPDRVPVPVSIAIVPPPTKPISPLHLSASTKVVANATAAIMGAMAGSKGTGQHGFMPMMPMGAGGATGDEAPEPKRRSSRR